MSSADRRSIPLDDVFGLLAEPRRRSLVCCLLSDGGGTVDDLVGRVMAREGDEAVDDRDEAADDRSAARNRLEVSLVHDHLPRLESHDVVDYDPERGVVEPGDRFDALAAFVEVGEDGIRPPTRG